MNIFSRTLNVLVHTKIEKKIFFSHNMEHLWSLSNMTRVHVDSVLPYPRKPDSFDLNELSDSGLGEQIIEFFSTDNYESVLQKIIR